jgi:hypothetical protein
MRPNAIAGLVATVPGLSFSDIVAAATKLSNSGGVAAGACALTMFWNGVGEACLAAGAVAVAVARGIKRYNRRI